MIKSCQQLIRLHCLLTYGYVCSQYSLVHGEGPDVKVVDRRHTLHC